MIFYMDNIVVQLVGIAVLIVLAVISGVKFLLLLCFELVISAVLLK